MARRPWLGALAMASFLAAGAAAAEPMLAPGRPGAPIWEQHGAGRTDGLAVGAYPLPPQPEGIDRARPLDPGARERWLRRHYQWLRALMGVLNAPLPTGRRGPPDRAGATTASFAQASPPGALRLGDLIVLYAGDPASGLAPHLLDDGALNEDPELALKGGDALQFIVSDRLLAESAQIVAQFLSPLAQGLRGAVGDALLERERLRNARYGAASAERPFHAAAPLAAAETADPPARAVGPREPITMLGFFKNIVLDVLSAPTTYLLAFIALIGWVILRATVFARS